MKLVKYTCYIDVKDEFKMKNGRLKLADVGEVVSEACLKSVARTSHIFDLTAEVSEVVRTTGVEEEDGSYIKTTGTYAKVVAEKEMPNFPHVRKEVLRRHPEEYVNYMPKAPFEEVVFRFFQEVGINLLTERYGSIPIMTIRIDDGSYNEEVLFNSKDEDIYSPKNIREYEKLLVQLYGPDTTTNDV